MIYVSSSCIKKHNIAEVIRQLAEHNICNIELSGGTEYYDEIETDLIILKQQYHLNYVCHAYFPPPKAHFVVNLASCNDQIYQQSINHYIQCIDMMKRIDCKVLSIHAGFLVEVGTNEIGKSIHAVTIYDEDKAYDRFCTAYERISRLCVENDIDFYLENNVLSEENYKNFGYRNYFMMTDYASIMKIKKQLDFNLLLDLGHLYVSSNSLGLDYEQECNALKEHVKWIHISENNGVVDEHKTLREKSIIINEFYKLQKPLINVTLETTGDIEEILDSVELIKKQKSI